MMKPAPTTDGTRLFGVGPVLPVRDVAASATFYCEWPGFELDYVMGNPPSRGSVTRGRVGIQFTAAPESFDAGTYPGWIYVFVDNIHALRDEYERQGVTMTQSLADHDHGMTEFEIEDLDGFRLRFGQYR